LRESDWEERDDVNGPVICGIENANEDTVAAVARELAERYELPLFFVHVLRDADGHEDATRLLREATAPGSGELEIESGHPADRLVDLARGREASFLVVGNHGPRSSLLGSISADVSRRASCPVVVVPPTADVGAQAQVAGSDTDVRGGIVRFALGNPERRVA
jgi:nucleotide-binding universal stress UspA family protein